MNDRYECHRLKEGESFPLKQGEISFGPSVRRYGKGPSPNDPIFSFHLYSRREMEEQLDPDEFEERKKARARFKTAPLCVLLPRASVISTNNKCIAREVLRNVW